MAVLLIQEMSLLFKSFPAPYIINKGSKSDYPAIAIFLCARNEEKTIEACLKSILKQNYPNFVVYFSNDHSDDSTLDIVKTIESDNLKVFDSVLSHSSKLNPKAAQLAFLEENSKEEFIAVCDADCTYDENWLSEMYHGLGDKAQISSVTEVMGRPFYKGEWIGAMGRMSLISKGSALAAIGHNMLLTRSALQKCGGFIASADSATEDMRLNHLLRDAGFEARFVLFSKILVKTKAVNFRDSFNQRKRWIKGIDEIPIIYKIGVYMQGLFLVWLIPLLLFDFYLGLAVWLFYISIRSIVDLRIHLKINSGYSLLLLPILEIYRQIYALAFMIYHLLNPNFTWKGRKFE